MGTFSVRKTTEQFIAEARLIHGDKYDYSKVEYKTANDKVCIICPIHGEFWQRPYAHLNFKQGCRKCYEDKKRIGIIGLGIMDIAIDWHDPYMYKQYILWKNMIVRTCCPKYKSKYPSYHDASVCDEWLTFSTFKRWLDEPSTNYKIGYHLDKDIIVKGNMLYSPETCCFVPSELNMLFTNRKRCRGAYPIGVTYCSGGYVATLSTSGGDKYLGYYHSEIDAFNAYKFAKETHIKELAERYFQEGKITERVYNALMKYEVEITD